MRRQLLHMKTTRRGVIASVLLGLVAQMAYAPLLIAQEINRMQIRRAVADQATRDRVGVDAHAKPEYRLQQIRTHLQRLTMTEYRSDTLENDLGYLLEQLGEIKLRLLDRHRHTTRVASSGGQTLRSVTDTALRQERHQLVALETELRSLLGSVQDDRLGELARTRISGMLTPPIEELSGKLITGQDRPLARQIQRSPAKRTGATGPYAYPWAVASLDESVIGELFLNIGDDWIAEGDPVDEDTQPSHPYIDFGTEPLDPEADCADIETPGYDPVRCLASQLEHDPLKILNYVRNEIRYDPYLGAHKSASRTLRDKSGNDLDIASALIALLRSSGVPARYVFGTIEMTESEVLQWLGTVDLNDASRWLSDAGVANQLDDLEGVLRVDHVWVSAHLDVEPYRAATGNIGIGDSWVDLDASFKRHQMFGRATADDIGADPQNLRSTVLGSSVGDDGSQEGLQWITGCDADFVEQEVRTRAGLLESYLDANQIPVAHSFRERHVVPDDVGFVPLSDFYAVHARGLSTRHVPASLRSTVTVELVADHGTLRYTGSVAELAERSIIAVGPLTDESLADTVLLGGTLDSLNASLLWTTPRLFIDDVEVQATDLSIDASPTRVGTPMELSVDVDLPGVVTTPHLVELFAGGVASIVINPHEVTIGDLQSAAEAIETVQPDLESLRTSSTTVTMSESERAATIARAMGPALHAMGLGYFYQVDRANTIAASSLDLAVVRTPSAAVVAWNVEPEYVVTGANASPFRVNAGPLSIRAIRDTHVVAPLANSARQEPRDFPEAQFLRIASMTASVLESASIKHAVKADESLSLIDVLHQANGDAGRKVYSIDPNTAAQLPAWFGNGGMLGSVVSGAMTAEQTVTAADGAFDFGGTATESYTGALLRDGTREGTELVVVDANSGTIASALVDRDWMNLRDVAPANAGDPVPTPGLEQVLVFDQFSTAYENLLQSTLEWLEILQPGYEQNAISYAVASIHGDAWTDTADEYSRETDTLLALLLHDIGKQNTTDSVILSAGLRSTDQTRPDWIGNSGDARFTAELVRAGAWQLEAKGTAPNEDTYTVLADGEIQPTFGTSGIDVVIEDYAMSVPDLDGTHEWRLLVRPPGDGPLLPVLDDAPDTVIWSGQIAVDRVHPTGEIAVATPSVPGVPPASGEPARGTIRVEGWAEDYVALDSSFASMNFEQFTISVQGPSDLEPVVVHIEPQPVPPLDGADPNSVLALIDSTGYSQDDLLHVTLDATDFAGNTFSASVTDVRVENPLVDSEAPEIAIASVAIAGGTAQLSPGNLCEYNAITDSNITGVPVNGSNAGELIFTLDGDDVPTSVTSLTGEIETLELWLNDTLVARTQLEPPRTTLASYAWETGYSAYALPNGDMTLKVRAIDSAGQASPFDELCTNVDLVINAFGVNPETATHSNPRVQLGAIVRADPLEERDYRFGFQAYDSNSGLWSAIVYHNDLDTTELEGTIPANAGPRLIESSRVRISHLLGPQSGAQIPDGGTYRAVLEMFDAGSVIPIATAYTPFRVNVVEDVVNILISDPASPRAPGTLDVDDEGRPIALIDSPTMPVRGVLWLPDATASDTMEYTFSLWTQEAANNAQLPDFVAVPPAEGTLWTWTEYTGAPNPQIVGAHVLGYEDSLFAKFDMTSIPNGSYILRLTAGQQVVPNSPAFDVPISVSSQAKVGELAFAQEDSAPQIGTVPVTLTRSYSSNATHAGGPFGPGWSMGLFDLDVEIAGNRVKLDSGSGRSVRKDSNPLNRSVTLTLPNGQRATFMFDLFKLGSQFAPRYVPQFVSPPGADAHLSTLWTGNSDLELEPQNIITGPYSTWLGNYYDISFDMPAYRLTLEDGTKYDIERPLWFDGLHWVDGDVEQRISGKPYVSRIELPDGTVIEPEYDDDNSNDKQMLGVNYTETGMASPQQALEFVWHSDNGYTGDADSGTNARVGALKVDGDIYYLYGYDQHGRLIHVCRVTDESINDSPPDLTNRSSILSLINAATPLGDVTTFAYEDGTHRLSGVTDPRGVDVLTPSYDDAGRMAGSKDAFGKSISIDRDVENQSETVTARDATSTTYKYDDLGNVTDELLPNNVIVKREYESTHGGGEGLVTKETRVSSDTQSEQTTHYEYDHELNQTFVVQPDLSATQTEYEYFSGSSIPRTVVTRSGSVTGRQDDTWVGFVPKSVSRQTFDERGNLLRSSSAQGDNSPEKQVTQYEYDDRGRILTVLVGGDVELDRDRPSPPFPNATIYTYDESRPALGSKPVRITRYGDSVSEAESVQTFEYDDQYRQIRSLSAVLNEATQQYDIVGQYTKFDYVGRSEATASIEFEGAGADATSALANNNIPSNYAALESPAVGVEVRYESASYYDGNDQLIASVDRQNNRTTTTLRDARGDVIETAEWHFNLSDEAADQSELDAFFGWFRSANADATPPALPSSVLDLKVVVTRTMYDEASRPIYTTDRQVYSSISQYAIDTGAPDTATGGTQTRYDTAGRAYHILRYGRGQSMTGEGTVTITFAAHDHMGLRTTKAQVSGTPFTQSYTHYDSLGRVEYSEDAAGTRTSYTYDANNRQQTVTVEYRGTGPDSSLTTEYGYDELGRVDTVINPEGVLTTYEYDAQGRRRAAHFEATADHGTSSITTVYDDDGRRIRETNQMGQARRFVYDDSDRLRAVLLPNPETGITYDGAVVLDDSPSDSNASLRDAATIGEGPVYAYWYDDQGNITHLLSPKKATGSDIEGLFSETSLEYDSTGRRTKRTLPGNRSEGWRFGRDADNSNMNGADDRLWLHQDFVGNITRHVYDDHGRITDRFYYKFIGVSKPGLNTFDETQTDPVGSHADYTLDILHNMTYDNLDRIQTVKIHDGTTLRDSITYSYSPHHGRLYMINSTDRGTLSYTYFDDGRIKSIDADDETLTEYTYDFAGRLKTVATEGIGDWEYEYTRLGQRSKLEYTSATGDTQFNTTTLYTYDRLGRLDTLTNRVGPGGAAPAGSFDYTVRADGRRTAVVETGLGGVATADIRYQYDYLNRLNLEDYGDSASDRQIRYEYDIAGNRTLKQIQDGMANPTDTISYDYLGAAPDWLTQERHEDAQGSTTKIIDYERDDNGFLIEKRTDNSALVEQYTPDAMGRLAGYSNNESGDDLVAATYRYDHRGILTHQDIDFGTSGTSNSQIRHLIDRFNPTGYAQRIRTVKTSTLPGESGAFDRAFGDDLLGEDVGASCAVQLYDGQGTTRNFYGPGAGFESYSFDAYGEQLPWVTDDLDNTTPPMTNHLYTGEARDSAATGWTYLRARYLDTTTGTFNRLDPFFGNTDDPQSLHKYAYVHADPVNAWDPTGYVTVSSVIANIGFRSFLTSTGVSVIAGAILGGSLGGLLSDNLIGGVVSGSIAGAQLGFAANLWRFMSIPDKGRVLFAAFLSVCAEIIKQAIERLHGTVWSNTHLAFGWMVAFAEGAYDETLDIMSGKSRHIAGFYDIVRALTRTLRGLANAGNGLKSSADTIQSLDYLEVTIDVLLGLSLKGGGAVPRAASRRVRAILARGAPILGASQAESMAIIGKTFIYETGHMILVEFIEAVPGAGNILLNDDS